MDPRLDTGLIAKEGVGRRDLNEMECLSLVDMVLKCVPEWMAGQSLISSYFACLYIEKPSPIISVIVGLESVLTSLREIVGNGAVCFEEDFDFGMAGFKFEGVTYPESGFNFGSDLSDAIAVKLQCRMEFLELVDMIFKSLRTLRKRDDTETVCGWIQNALKVLGEIGDGCEEIMEEAFDVVKMRFEQI